MQYQTYHLLVLYWRELMTVSQPAPPAQSRVFKRPRAARKSPWYSACRCGRRSGAYRESSRYYQGQFELNDGADRYAGSLGVCCSVRSTVRYFARTHGRIWTRGCAPREPHLTILEIARNGCFY